MSDTVAAPSLSKAARTARNAGSTCSGAGRPDDAEILACLTPEVRSMLDCFRLDEIGSHLLRRAHFQAEELFSHEFSDLPITPRQKAALVVVYQRPGLNQSALASCLFMDRNTVADMVRRLVDAQLLRRVPAQDDQRSYHLYLTPSGAELLNRVMPRDARVEAAVLDRLPAEYRSIFLKCLRMLVEPATGGTAAG